MRCMEMVPGDTACRGARGVSVKVTPRAHGFRRPDHRAGLRERVVNQRLRVRRPAAGLGLGTSRAPTGLGCARPIFDPLGHFLFPPRDGAGADAHVGREKVSVHQGVERGAREAGTPHDLCEPQKPFSDAHGGHLTQNHAEPELWCQPVWARVMCLVGNPQYTEGKV